MKKLILALITVVSLLSCNSVKEIGDLNMVSTRNVDSQTNYVLLSTYQGSDKKILKKSRFKSLEAAIDHVVSSVPGGEIMKNVKVYLISSEYLAVSGDVWGNKIEVDAFQGFEKNQKVLYKKGKKDFVDAEIISFTNSKKCIIRYKQLNVLSGKTKEIEKEVSISDLRKK